MLQRDRETGGLLTKAGLREMDLIGAIRVAGEEPSSAMEVASERATRLANDLGHTPRPAHLLAAIVREGRSAGYRCLERAGTDPRRLHLEVQSLLGVGSAVAGGTRKRSSKPASQYDR